MNESTPKSKKAANQQHSRKLFLSILVTYFATLAVVLVALGVGFGCSIATARKSMENSQLVILERVQREIDIRLENIKNIASFLASHMLTKEVAEIEQDTPWDQITYLDLKETMIEQGNLMQGRGDIALYFFKSDSVLASRRYRSENLSSYCHQLGLTVEEFQSFTQLPNIKSMYKILHPNTAQAKLVYLEPVIDSDYHQVGTAMTFVSTSFFDSSLNFEGWMEGSACYMVNNTDSLSIGGGTTTGELPFKVNSSSAAEEEGVPTVITANGTKYVTVSLPSSDKLWRYYFSIPLSSFTKGQAFYLAVFVGAVCLAIFSGIVLSWVFAYRFYRPVNSILLQFHVGLGQAFPEAITAVEHAMSAYQNDLQEARTLLKGASRQRRNAFLLALCRGRIAVPQIKVGIDKHRLALTDSPLRLAVFTFHDTETSVFCQNGLVDSELMLYASSNVMEELLCAKQGAVFSHDGQIYCIYQEREDSQGWEGLLKQLTYLYNFHKDVLKIRLHILVSQEGKGYTDLPELFLETDEMQQFKAFWENDVEDILRYEDMRQEESPGGDYSYLDDEKRFINLLAIKDYGEAHQILKSLFGRGAKDAHHLRQKRYKIYGFLSNLIESISRPWGEDAPQTEKLQLSAEELLTVKSVDVLRQKTDQLFEDLIAYDKEQRAHQETVPWVQEVRDYIQDHYTDPQMDVSYLAELFHLNVSHLSRTYKKLTSIGVLDNIHMVRIAKAKELLAQGANVQETSAQVGYQESRALIRAFKRYEGITPGQYQEMNAPL